MSKKSKQLPAEVTRNELKNAYIRAYVAAAFNQTKAMEAVGIKSRSTIWEWRKTDKDFANALNEAREAEGDFLENQMRVLARGIPEVDKETGTLIGWKERPDATAINSMLNAKFKDRGYGFRIKHEHENLNKKESRIDLNRLTKAEREQWYILLDKATIPDGEVHEAEIILDDET